VTVQHILIGFTGSIPGKDITRTREEAEQLARQLLDRARAGEDFAALVSESTNDQSPGIYAMSNVTVTPPKPGPGETKTDQTESTTQDENRSIPATEPPANVYPRAGMVRAFGDVSFSLEPGQIGMTEYHATYSPYGWHIIKRLD
jgi:hypothetical protein